MGFRLVRDELYKLLDKRKVIFGAPSFGLVNGLVQMQIPTYQEYVRFGWIERVTLLISSPLKTSM